MLNVCFLRKRVCFQYKLLWISIKKIFFLIQDSPSFICLRRAQDLFVISKSLFCDFVLFVRQKKHDGTFYTLTAVESFFLDDIRSRIYAFFLWKNRTSFGSFLCTVPQLFHYVLFCFSMRQSITGSHCIRIPVRRFGAVYLRKSSGFL